MSIFRSLTSSGGAASLRRECDGIDAIVETLSARPLELLLSGFAISAILPTFSTGTRRVADDDGGEVVGDDVALKGEHCEQRWRRINSSSLRRVVIRGCACKTII